MATSPSAPQPSSSMEESQQPEQPISTQQDGEAHDTPVTSQPVSAEQRAPPPTTDAPDAKQAEEDRNMDHLTVISDNMETSKYTRPAPAHRHIPHCDSPQQFLFSLLSNDILLPVEYFYFSHIILVPNTLDSGLLLTGGSFYYFYYKSKIQMFLPRLKLYNVVFYRPKSFQV